MQLPWRQQVLAGCSAPTSSASSARSAAQNFVQICPPPRRRRADARADPVPGAHGASRRVPDLDRRRRVRRHRRARPRPRARPRRSARRSAAAAGSCSASTGSTTPRASTCASRRSASCSQSGVTTRRRDGARAGRHAEPRARRALPPAARERRARGRAHQRRVRARRPPGGPLPAPLVQREDLCALYCAADVMLVTPLRDGMNLVCKEYVAARHRGGGALVLASSPARPASCGRRCSCNPHDVRMRETIARAIALPRGRGAPADARACAARCARHDVHRWARDVPRGARGAAGMSAEPRQRRHAAARSSGARAARARAAPAGRLRLRRHARADRRGPDRGHAPPESVAALRALAALPRHHGRGHLRPRAARPGRAVPAARARSTSSAATAPSSTSASSRALAPEALALRDRAAPTAARDRRAAAGRHAGAQAGRRRRALPRGPDEDAARRWPRSATGPAPLAGRARTRGQGGHRAVRRADRQGRRARRAAPPGRRHARPSSSATTSPTRTPSPPARAPTSASRSAPARRSPSYRVAGPRGVARLLALLWRRGATGSPARTPCRSSATRCSPTADRRAGDPGRARHVAVPPAPRLAPRSSPSSSAAAPAGYFASRPAHGGRRCGQRYVDDTMTRRDPLGRPDRHRLLDRGEPAGAAPRARARRARRGVVEFAPRPDFGRGRSRCSRGRGLRRLGAAEPMVLRAPGLEWEIHVDGVHRRARAMSDPPGATWCWSCAAAPTTSRPTRAEPERRERTERYWRDWLRSSLPALARRRSRARADPAGAVPRPDRGILAAATTSPARGHRRRAQLGLPLLLAARRRADRAGAGRPRLDAEAEAFLLAGSSAGAAEHGAGAAAPALHALRQRARPGGGDRRPARLRRQPPGPRRQRRRRAGAARRVRADRGARRRRARSPAAGSGAAWTGARRADGRRRRRRWHEPDHGIWEVRDKPRHHVYSKVMCWLTVDRALRLAAASTARRAPLGALRDRIAQDVIEHGWSGTRVHRRLRRRRPGRRVPARRALRPAAPDDERFPATVDAVEAGTARGPDGLPLPQRRRPARRRGRLPPVRALA